LGFSSSWVLGVRKGLVAIPETMLRSREKWPLKDHDIADHHSTTHPEAHDVDEFDNIDEQIVNVSFLLALLALVFCSVTGLVVLIILGATYYWAKNGN
jgi:hypothetical protein